MPTKTVKWEYTMTTSFTKVNELGKDGWELIFAINSTNQGPPMFYLKREL